MAYPAQPTDLNVIPVSSAYNPKTGLFRAVRGWNAYTDASANDSNSIAASLEDGGKATYAVTVTGITPVATPTDWIVLPGSASKTIRLVRFEISGAATAAGIWTVQLVKRTTANTAGTSAAMTIVRHDENDGAASAAPVRYTANPTGLGTGVNIRAFRLFLNTLTTQPERFVLNFGDRPAEAIILRGTAQAFAVNFNGAAVPAGTVLDCALEWTEE